MFYQQDISVIVIIYRECNEKHGEEENQILYLKCEDTYDHLPTKVFLMIRAILDIDEFSSVSHIFKLDDR